MEVSEIVKLEQSNKGIIYISVDNSGNFVAYNLSAYILSKAYGTSITPEVKDLGRGARNTLMAIIPPDFISIHFAGHNTLVGDDCIQVDLAESFGDEIIEWRNEFKIQKKDLVI